MLSRFFMPQTASGRHTSVRSGPDPGRLFLRPTRTARSRSSCSATAAVRLAAGQSTFRYRTSGTRLRRRTRWITRISSNRRRWARTARPSRSARRGSRDGSTIGSSPPRPSLGAERVGYRPATALADGPRRFAGKRRGPVRSVVALAPAGSSKVVPNIIPATLTFEWGRDVPTLCSSRRTISAAQWMACASS